MGFVSSSVFIAGSPHSTAEVNNSDPYLPISLLGKFTFRLFSCQWSELKLHSKPEFQLLQKNGTGEAARQDYGGPYRTLSMHGSQVMRKS